MCCLTKDVKREVANTRARSTVLPALPVPGAPQNKTECNVRASINRSREEREADTPPRGGA